MNVRRRSRCRSSPSPRLMSIPLPEILLKTKKYGTFSLTSFDPRDQSLRFDLKDPNTVVLRNGTDETTLESAFVDLSLDTRGRWTAGCLIHEASSFGDWKRFEDWIEAAVSKAMYSWARANRNAFAALATVMTAMTLDRIAGDLVSVREERHAAQARLNALANRESQCDRMLVDLAKTNPRAVPMALMDASPMIKEILILGVVPKL